MSGDWAGIARAATVCAALAAATGAAQATPEHMDPALGGAVATDAASVLVTDPGAIARARIERGLAASPAPLTGFRQTLADAMPAGAVWTQVYARTGYAPIWLVEEGGGRLGWAKVDALLRAARGAEAHALPMAPYGLDALEARIAAARAGGAPEEVAAIEIALTKMFLHLGRDLASGALEPRQISKNLDVSPPRPEPMTLLATATSWSAADAEAQIEALAPRSADYLALKALYAELKAVRAAGGWGATVPAGPTLRALDKGPRVAALRGRLKAMGYLAADADDLIDPATGAVVFGPMTDQAVRDFQADHGLDVDGVVGAATLGALNLTLDERIGLVAVNLERVRWLNFELGARHIIVNIAAFEARVVDNGSVTFATRVVVGKKRHQTPEFSDEMSHIVVNPYWHVPYSIATEELLPQLQDNPGALAARNFEVHYTGGGRVDPWSVDWWGLSTSYFPYQLKQGPGPGNALGGVKFIFPNHHAVYLHDTPAKSLFEKVVRAFSHGCVRVADPTGLAEVLLAPQEADPLGYFFALRERRSEVYVHLDRHVPVHLTYRTVWVDADGAVQMRGDVYGRDRLIFDALRGLGLSG